MDMQELAKEFGFESAEEMNRMIARVDLSTTEKAEAFRKWQGEDGTKAGLEKLLPFEEALKDLRALIAEQHKDWEDISVSVFTSGAARIEEISVSRSNGRGTAGFALMSDEPGCFGVLFAAERYLLHHGTAPHRPEGWESDIDPFAEAVENFLHAYNAA